MRAFAAMLELLGAETRDGESGSERAAALLTEMLLIHVIRAVITNGQASVGPGRVEGLRDPQIAGALAAIHREPELPWSVASLAARAAMSRSVFADRFAQRLGCTPMRYLARWRLQKSPPGSCGNPV